MGKRHLDIAVISDLHLGTYGCHATEVNHYLKSIKPNVLVLNGDIIDIWQFKKSWFPESHMEVIRTILKLASNGTKVYYLTGNHDDALRKFGEMSFGNVDLRNQLVFQVDGKNHWIFHGDIFDASVKHAQWVAKLGGKGYDFLIRINRFVNAARKMLGLKPVSFSSKVKKKVKGAVKHIQDFEQSAIELAASKGYDYVICGHIHIPQSRVVQTEHGDITYLNSGDWVESLTSLEYEEGKWSLYQYDPLDFEHSNPKLDVKAKKEGKEQVSKDSLLPAAVALRAML